MKSHGIEEPGAARGIEGASAVGHRVATALVVLACVAFAVHGVHESLKQGSDFTIYYAAAEAALAGEDPLAVPGYIYLPFFAALVSPLALAPYRVAAVLWSAASLALLLFCARRAARLAAADVERAPAFLNWLPLACLIRLADSNLANGQVNAFTLAMMLLSATCLLANRDVAAGLWAGLAAATKIVPGFLLVYFVLRGRFRAAGIGIAIAAALVFLAPVPVLGWSVNAHGLRAWWSSTAAPFLAGGDALLDASQHPPGQGLAAACYRWLSDVPASAGDDVPRVHVLDLAPDRVRWIVRALMAAHVLLFAWVVLVRRLRRAPDTAEFGFVLCTALLLAPLVHKAHVLWVLVGVTALFARLGPGARKAWATPPTLVLFAGLAAISLTTPAIVGRAAATWLLTQNTVFVGLELIWFALLWHLHTQRGNGVASATPAPYHHGMAIQKTLGLGVVALFLCTASVPCAVEPPHLRQHDNTLYELPEDWSGGYRDGYATCKPDDHRTVGFCTIYIGASEDAPRDAEKWLTAKQGAVVDEDARVTSEQPAVRTKLGEHDVVMAGRSVDGDLQIHVAISAADRIQHVWFEGPADEKGEQAASGVFMPFCAGLRFVSAGAKPLLEQPRAGKLEGTYFAAVFGYGLNGVEFQNRFWSFTPAGRFFEGIPEGRSLRTIDFETAVLLEGHDCGNYAVRGKRLELRYGNGEVRKLDFEGQGEELVINGDKYWLQAEIADGTRMDGCWQAFNYSSFTRGSGVEGGAGSTRTLTLRPDGTFESEGLGFASASFEGPTGDRTGGITTSSKRRKQEGEYEFRDGVLVLTDKTGARTTKNVILVSPRLLLVNGSAHIDESKAHDQAPSEARER